MRISPAGTSTDATRRGAVVKLARQSRVLLPGDELTFGRNPDRDLRFAYDPVDDYVSRRAGTLLGQSDRVLVRNDSRTQDLILAGLSRPGDGHRAGRDDRHQLCEPVLILAGDAAVPATYRQIAVRVGQTPASVRSCLDQLRQRFTDSDGIPGLRGDGADHERLDYRAALARWAINSGTVGPAELGLLNPLPGVGTAGVN